MAEKQTAEDENPASKAGFEFPFEWVSQHCDGAGASFTMNKELAGKFSQLKVMNEAADSDGTRILESLLNTQKNLEHSVNNYKTMMEGLPVDTSDLPQDSLQNFDAVVQNTLTFGGDGSDDVMTELMETNYNKEIARMEMVSQTLDGILSQIDVMKEQFLKEFGEGLEEEESSGVEPSDRAEFLEEKVAACKEDYNEEEAKRFMKAFKEYIEVKDFLNKMEKEKSIESRLDAALAKYKDLPPDLALAREALKKQEKEMRDLNAEIEFLKNNMDDGALDMFNP